MGDLNFGKSFNIKEPGERPFKDMPQTIERSMQFYYPIPSKMCHSPFLDTLLWLKPRDLEALLDFISPPASKTYMKFFDESVTKRLALQKKQNELPEQERRQDIFYFLYNAIDPAISLTAYDAKILKAEAGLLVVAGSHTTSASLSGIFFYLTGDPRRLIKVQNKIRGVFELTNDIIHGPKLASCTYLRACVDEAMRLTSSGPSELPREVLRGGIHIQGQYYPAGTIVGTSSWCDARNQRVYGDPDVYRPERWIVDEAEGVTKEHVARLKANFNPFGAGPGHCVGKVFAMSEILIAVARTLHRLEVRRTPGSTLGAGHPSLGWGARNPQQLHLKDAYITIRHGPEVQFRKRTTGSLGE
ncbi:benzoate 4-monooxygenase cytochrome P450 [Metarhizium guizhouense ARSEF 977]|uniref:Benzoate 4-monooxygenase cytochrome P450 n=1 Tax=Metarhizium guizhouense (strain ARSEF 977) TaxID=1276136 RepID=A0A0B4GQI1_METGA|nr:benzoate 4-monooxygenase cytochrome P450 [Metarhizium guizhouense ARSEF 977]